MALFNVRHCKSFPVKTLLGEIHESLAQLIFPHAWYMYMAVTDFSIIVYILRYVLCIGV